MLFDELLRVLEKYSCDDDAFVRGNNLMIGSERVVPEMELYPIRMYTFGTVAQHVR